MIKGIDLSKRKTINKVEKVDNEDIAIVGMDIRLPGIKNEYEFWELLAGEKECKHKLSENRSRRVIDFISNTGYEWNESFPFGGFLDEIDEFDCDYFNILPREAEMMNPVQRMLLMSVRNLFENAGYTDEAIRGSDTGVYLGMIGDLGVDKYKEIILKKEEKKYLGLGVTGNLSSISTGRISYFWDFSGPSMLIDTACSSSLVALHTACNAIRNSECSQAVVVGVNIDILPGVNQIKVGFESISNCTRPFSNNADGTGFGEGIISLFIKPLGAATDDKDNIYAVIKGSAVNQDGQTMGITAPNPEAQMKVIMKAWDAAGINPNDITYIETHGTGTVLGDPIEVEGINMAFAHTEKYKMSCGIGSVKSNIGHLYGASGLAGVVKCALSLKYKTIPASINIGIPNKRIDWQTSYVYLVDHLKKWGEENLLCGVSSFGFSGTNCHMILSESKKKLVTDKAEVIFTLSAKSREELIKLLGIYYEFVATHQELDYKDICYTSCVGRRHYKYRSATWVSSREDLLDFLMNPVTNILYEEMASEKHMQINISDDIYDDKENLIKAYYEGADIQWSKLYTNIDVKKTCLPNNIHNMQNYWIGMIDQTTSNKEVSIIKEDMDYSKIETEIADIVIEVLGIKEIDIHQELMDYGGSSLMLAEIYEKINERYPDILTLSQLFIYTNIEKLANYIKSNLDKKNNIIIDTGSPEDEIDLLLERLQNGSESLDDALEKLMS